MYSYDGIMETYLKLKLLRGFWIAFQQAFNLLTVGFAKPKRK